MSYQFSYLIHIQYLGFRFHGWAKQPHLKTVHFMVDKTMEFVLGHSKFKTMGCSRTDSMVSANHSAFELFVDEMLEPEPLLMLINSNFPPDLKALKVERIEKPFNIIQAAKTKEYLYLFCFGEKPHPFTASLMMSFEENLDIELMQKGAKLFQGQHNFRRYCTKPSANAKFLRTIDLSEIVENKIYTANFFPSKSYLFRIRSKGFMRNQIRLMMGQLIALGKGDITLADIEKSLEGNDSEPLNFIAPASGLILQEVTFSS
jgi:tRNA pseudouridine38-40 synthase